MKIEKKQRKQIQAGLLIATIIVWCVFGYLFLEGTWKEDLEEQRKEQRNMTRYDIDWGNTTMPHFNDSGVENSTNKTNV